MEKESAESRLRKRLYGIKARLDDKDYRRKMKRIFIALAILLVIIFLAVVWMITTKVREIYVDGELVAYNETKIIESMGINIGDSIFSKTRMGIKREIRKNLPLAENIKVRKNVFSGVISVDVEFADMEFFIKYGKRYYAVDKDLTVVDMRASKSEYFALGAVYLYLPEVTAPTIGEKLIFRATVPDDMDPSREVADVKDFEYITNMLAEIKGSQIYDDFNVISLDNKFDISAVVMEKYRVYFGNSSNAELKLRMLDGVISDGALDYAEKGIIDITDPNRVSARAVNASASDSESSKVDFSEYFS